MNSEERQVMTGLYDQLRDLHRYLWANDPAEAGARHDEIDDVLAAAERVLAPVTPVSPPR